jgi:hypothetical protein
VKILLVLPLLMVACSDYEIHDNNDALGKYNPPDLGADVKTDRIVQVTVPSVDVLWVIDNSCSMEEEQSSLTANFSKFMNYFTNSGLDYHVGVVSTDMDSGAHSGKLRRDAGNSFIDTTYSASEAAQSFTRRARMGTSGSGWERGLDAAWASIVTHGNGNNSGFYREEAAFAMIVISDEEDSSDISVNEFSSWATALKPASDMVSFSSIVWQQQCGNGPWGETVGSRYLSVTNTVGGIDWPICNTNWDSVLTELGMQAAGLRREFYLSSVPVVDSIAVVVQDDNGNSQEFQIDADYEYDRARNSIRFQSFVPEPLDEVLISYEVLASASIEDELGGDTGE